MPAWLIWAIAAVLLSAGELLTPGMFFLGPVALAAIGAGIVAALGVGVVGLLLVFIGGSVASVLFLEGTKAVVLQRVDVHGGRVRIGGEEWSARAYMEDQVLEPGTRVEVVKIEGATALVYE